MIGRNRRSKNSMEGLKIKLKKNLRIQNKKRENEKKKNAMKLENC